MLGCSSKLCNRLRSFVKQDIVVLESRAPVEILHGNGTVALVHRISFVGLSLFLIALAIIVVDRAN